MATRKQVKELEDEILRLNKENESLKCSLAGANHTINQLTFSNEDLHNLNNHLADERDRISKSDNINREMCTSLMNAVAILGRNEMQRISSEVWHSCQPRQMQAMTINNQTNQKDMDNYFDANS